LASDDLILNFGGGTGGPEISLGAAPLASLRTAPECRKLEVASYCKTAGGHMIPPQEHV